MCEDQTRQCGRIESIQGVMFLVWGFKGAPIKPCNLRRGDTIRGSVPLLFAYSWLDLVCGVRARETSASQTSDGS